MSDDITTSGPDSIVSPTRTSLGKLVRGLSLSRIQAVVAIVAGSATVFGAAFSVAPVGRATRTGTLVAVIHTTGASQNVADATVEVLTPDNALVASLTPDPEGRVRRTLREGVYVVRVSEPHFVVDVHRVDVQAGQTIEVKTTLRPGSSSSADRTLNKGVNAIRRALGIR